MELLTPFGPRMGKFQLPDNILEALLKLTDKTIQDQKEVWNGNLAGRINEEWRILPEDTDFEIVTYLEKCIEEYVTVAAPLTKHRVPRIRKMWVNEMEAGEYNPVHRHLNGAISSVIYLKVPDLSKSNIGNKRKIKPGVNTDGKIEFIRSVSNAYDNGKIMYTPKVGDFYLFPATLLHVVYPF